MWNRNARQTGSNEAPLAAPRRWGGGAGGDGAPPPPPPPPHGGGYGRDDRGPPGGGYGRDDRGGGGGYGGDSRGSYEDRRGPYDSRGPPGGGYDSRDSRDSRGPPPGDRYGGSGGGSRFDDRGRPPPPPPPMPQGSAWGAPDPYSSNAPPPPAPSALDALNSGGERKRKSRWGNDKVEGGAMPTAITGGVEGKDLENYAAQLRLDEIARALRSGLVVPPDGSRSPSPPPTYDSHGRRTNTREVRYRKKLEDERMRLVERQIKSDPSFKPPPEYLMAKRQNSGRPTDKVYIPVKEFPEINFFGLLVGPRGNSLKTMERDSGAKISIRGKGSVKEGKGRPGGPAEDENDELHCLITADTEEKVQRCVKLINTVIETAASVPEGQNDHKRSQLRELASLNGTLRDDENQICQNCGGIGHRKYDCPEQKNWTAGIICRVCGGAGHMARDCTQRRPGFGGPPGPPGFAPPGAGPDQARAQQFDSEYASLMAELGETSAAPPAAVAAGGGTPDANGQPAAPGAPWNAGPHGGHPVDANGEKIPPWRIPSNWHPPQPPPGNFNRGPPPQQQHYGGQQQGYSSFPQANMGGGQYGGYPPQQGGGYGGPQQGGYPGQGYGR